MALARGDVRAVRAFTRADLKPTVMALARAFLDDPVMTWIFPGDAMRERQLPRFFSVTMRSVSLRRPGTEIMVDGSRVLGAAIWVAPGAWLPSARQQLAALPGFGWALRSRFMVANTTYAAILRSHPHRPHWYLSGIGTDPPAQGSGVGTALMRSRLAKCDAEGLPAYLESSKESNVPFYEHHGFRVTEELAIPGGGPSLWLMWREPVR